MPEADSSDTKQFRPEVPQVQEPFFLKGSAAYDWGMQHRLASIFRPSTGRTVMLAIDHGYFQGPTSGLERVDLNIVPLIPHADALMLTRGILRSVVPPSMGQGIVVRASGGPSILKDALCGAFRVFDSSGNQVALVKGDWKGWNFRFLDENNNELGKITKKWAGIGKELFTSADNYIISMNETPSAGKAILLLAAGLAVDTVYKER